MTAERTLIDAMARDILRDMYADKYGEVPDASVIAEIRSMGDHSTWNRTVDVAARAALRALHDHGPTPAMVEAGARAIEETELRDVWEGDPKGFYWAWMDCSSAAFKASLTAELEERQ